MQAIPVAELKSQDTGRQLLSDASTSRRQDTELGRLVDQLHYAVQSIRGSDVLSDSELFVDDSSPTRSEADSGLAQASNSLHIILTHFLQHNVEQNLAETLSPVFFRLFAALSALSGFGHPGQGEMYREVTASLDLMALHCSPREILIAVQERLELLSRPGLLEQREHLDRGDVAAVIDPSLNATPTWHGPQELSQLLITLQQALPRLKTKQPDKFLQPVVPLLLAALKRQIAVLHAECSSDLISPKFAVTILLNTCQLCRDAHRWIQQAAPDVVPNTHLTLLVLGTVQILTPHLSLAGPSSLAQRYFLNRHPRYRLPSESTTTTEPQKNDAVWQAAEEVCSEMNVNARELLLRSTDERCRLGAFVLFINVQMQPHPSTSALSENPNVDDLDRTLPIVLAALREGCQNETQDDDEVVRGSELADCALVWLQSILDEKNENLLSDSILLPLCQAISLHAALSPVPSHRHISLHLFKVLCDQHATEEMAVELIKDALTETPFPQLKSAVIGVLKDIWLKRDVSGEHTVSNNDTEMRLLSPWAFQQLKRGLFTVPLPLPSPPSIQHLSSYMAVQFAIFNEALNLLFLLLRRSSLGERLRLHQHVSSLRTDFVDPLDSFVVLWESFSASTRHDIEDDDVLSSISLLRMTLEAVKASWPHEGKT